MRFLFLFLFMIPCASFAQEMFILDGFTEPVQKDTVTPANSIPLPVEVLSPTGLAIDFATEAKQDDIITELTTANTYLLSISGEDFATQTTLLAVAASLSSIDTKLTSPLTVTATNLDIRDLTSVTDSVGAVQSGTWNINNVSGTVSLPTGASTLVEQQSQTSLLTTIDVDTGNIATNTSAINGKLPGTLGQATMANSLAVVIASDQSDIPVTARSAQNTASYDEITNLTTSAQTFTAPAGAIGFKIQSPSTNSQNIRFKVGGAATTTSGMIMEPGRSEDFDSSTNVSVIAVAGSNQSVYIQWKVRP